MVELAAARSLWTVSISQSITLLYATGKLWHMLLITRRLDNKKGAEAPF